MAPHAPHSNPDTASDLALAVIASSTAPVLLLDQNLILVAASKSFCRVFEIDPPSLPGRSLGALGGGEWNHPSLTALLSATASGHANVECYEMDLKRPGRPDLHVEVNAQKLNYGDRKTIRLLMAVTDVTAARAAEHVRDELVKEKAVLLQELQHRVANSLQIIASVLMQSARQIQSDEARTHLYDAHHRVMSVAALQKQLAATGVDDVHMRPYFTALCDSIGASMIRDPAQVKLEVSVTDCKVVADVSVALGLIVTELVINALKHAFPDERHGTIRVVYHCHEKDWTLSVSDDGIGMAEDAEESKPGLGTNIIQALAKQLDATLEVTSAGPGTIITIAHSAAQAIKAANDAQAERAV